MITARQMGWIKRLHRNGVAKRAISRATGVSRETVATVLKDEPPHPDLRETLYDVEDPVFTQPPSRCDACGALVYKPCLACGLREQS